VMQTLLATLQDILKGSRVMGYGISCTLKELSGTTATDAFDDSDSSTSLGSVSPILNSANDEDSAAGRATEALTTSL
jgi:hypothetical protein